MLAPPIDCMVADWGQRGLLNVRCVDSRAAEAPPFVSSRPPAEARARGRSRSRGLQGRRAHRERARGVGARGQRGFARQGRQVLRGGRGRPGMRPMSGEAAGRADGPKQGGASGGRLRRADVRSWSQPAAAGPRTKPCPRGEMTRVADADRLVAGAAPRWAVDGGDRVERPREAMSSRPRRAPSEEGCIAHAPAATRRGAGRRSAQPAPAGLAADGAAEGAATAACGRGPPPPRRAALAPPAPPKDGYCFMLVRRRPARRRGS